LRNGARKAAKAPGSEGAAWSPKETTSLVGREELAQQQSPEQARENPYRQKEPRTARHPARVVEGDSAARDDHVHVWMIEDPLGVRQGAGGELYLAYLRDPEGNKLCALYRKPA